MNSRERKFCKENLGEVLHTTLNPYEPGVVRIHLVPAKYEPLKANPSVVILNGKDILPINLSWTILLAIFIKEVNKYKGNEVTDEELQKVIENTIEEAHKVYKMPKKEVLKKDLDRIISVFIDISEGKEPKEKIGQLSIRKICKQNASTTQNGPNDKQYDKKRKLELQPKMHTLLCIRPNLCRKTRNNNKRMEASNR